MCAGFNHTCMWKVDSLLCFGNTKNYDSYTKNYTNENYLKYPIAFNAENDLADAGGDSTCLMIDG